jgi:hypothetical protein
MSERARPDALAHALGRPASASGAQGLARGADHRMGLPALRPHCSTRLIPKGQQASAQGGGLHTPTSHREPF